MKRLYTCIKEAEDKQGPNIREYKRRADVIFWLRKHGVDVHKNVALAGQLIHQCRDGSWALLLLNGERMALKREPVPFFPQTIPSDSSDADPDPNVD